MRILQNAAASASSSMFVVTLEPHAAFKPKEEEEEEQTSTTDAPSSSADGDEPKGAEAPEASDETLVRVNTFTLAPGARMGETVYM